MDYLLGAYLTGIMQYPLDIINTQIENPESVTSKIGRELGLVKEEKIKGAFKSPIKREDEADFSSFKNAISIVTRRFKVASPIKNSKYHQEWQKVINRAKKLKQLDVTQMDLKKRNDSFLIGLGIRTLENIDLFGKPVEEEVLVFAEISPFLKKVEQKLLESRKERNNIMARPISNEQKRKEIDILLAAENQTLQQVVEALASTNIDFVFDQTITDNVADLGLIKGSLFSFIFGQLDRFGLGLQENTVKKNPRIE